MRRIHWYFGSITCAAVLAATTQVAGAGQLFKCKDDKGNITFSDRGCKLSPKEAAKRTVPTVQSLSQKAHGGVEKLTAANVEGLVLKAAIETDKGQCALLASDFLFRITDSTTTPPTSLFGGRSKMCNYIVQSSDMMRAAGITVTNTLGEIAVEVDQDGQLATAKYSSVQKMSAQNRPSINSRCVSEDQVGLYNGHILFKRSEASCVLEP